MIPRMNVVDDESESMLSLHSSLSNVAIALVLCRTRLTSLPHSRSSTTLKGAALHRQMINLISNVPLSVLSLVSNSMRSFHHLQLSTPAGKPAPSPFNLSRSFTGL